MAVRLPDPEQVAQQEVKRINENRKFWLDAPLDRVLADAPFVDRESLLEGLDAFHQERMSRIPSKTRYPESAVWVEHVLAVNRHLQRLADMTDRQLAMYRSLHHFLMFRGFAHARPRLVMAEKCRIAYLPETDQGQMHIKNVDDPATYWKKSCEPVKTLPLADLKIVQDGVGSGLHMDDEPAEIFPIEARQMVSHYAADVPGAVEFFTRYKSFWGGGNIVLHDRQKRSCAIEKCSYNFIEVFYPGPDGISHCSGMVCRDPNSPLGKYQRAQRDKYLKTFGQPSDGPDQTFWDACDRAERILAEGLAKLGRPAKADDVLRLFRTPWPQGLCKEAVKLHPQQAVEEYTLVVHASLLDKGRYIRWQRDDVTLKMPEEPEVYQF